MKRFTTTIVMLFALVAGVFANDGDSFVPTEGKYYSFRHAVYGQYVSFGDDVKIDDEYALGGADDSDGVWGFTAFKIEAVSGEEGYFTIALTADPSYYVTYTSGATASTSSNKNYVLIKQKPESGEFTDEYKWKIEEATPTNNQAGMSMTYSSGTVYGVYAKDGYSIRNGWNFYGGYNASTAHNICLYASPNSSVDGGYDYDLGSMWVLTEATWDASEYYNKAVDAAKADLDNNGVGYPTESSTVRTNLQAEYDKYNSESGTDKDAATGEGAWKKYQELVAATTAYEAEGSDVNLPEDGKVYKVYVKITTTDDSGNTVVTKLPVTFNEAGQAIVSTEEDADATPIVMQKAQTTTTEGGTERTKFYLGSIDGQNTLHFRNNEDLEDSDLLEVDASGAQGVVTIYGHADKNTAQADSPKGEDKSEGAYRYLAANASGSWDQLTVQTQYTNESTGLYSPLFVFEEVTDQAYTLNVKMQVTDKATAEWEKNLYFATVNLPYTVTLPTELTAYTATYSATDQTVTLEKANLTDNVLPFETPVIVSATAAGEYKLPPATYSAALTTGFTGVLYAKSNSSDNVYVFGSKGGVVQFYNVSNSYKFSANKAYLEIPGTNANALKFVFAGNDVTGIDAAPTANAADAAVYDLSGRRVYAPAKGGLYIKNGKKVVF